MIIAKNKTKQKSESSPVMGFQMAAVLMLLRRRQRVFLFTLKSYAPTSSWGTPPGLSARATSLIVRFGKAARGRKAAFLGL